MITFIIEILFFGFCGWLGHVAVKIVTLGKINLDYGDSSESVITEWIGAGVFLAIAMLISFLINVNWNHSSANTISTSREVQCGAPQIRSLPADAQQAIQEDGLTPKIASSVAQRNLDAIGC